MSEPMPEGVTLTQEQWDAWAARQETVKSLVEKELKEDRSIER